MIVNKIQPQGYCNGVKRALEIVDKALKDKTIPNQSLFSRNPDASRRFFINNNSLLYKILS